MRGVPRRSLIRSSAGLVAAGAVAHPYRANAAETTASVWWTEGFAQEEDIAFKKVVTEYEKASGNAIELTITPVAPLRQKIVAAVQSGVVPDVFPNNPLELLALFAWDNKLVDLTDVVETQKAQYGDTALATAYCYNSAERRRSFYGAPYTLAARPNHIWRSLIEKAGYSMEDLPRTWDAFYDFFKEVQKKLRAQGDRKVYGLGFQMNTTGNDCNALFDYFLIAYGGRDIVPKGGRLHPDDPQGGEGGGEGVIYSAPPDKEGFLPPAAGQLETSHAQNPSP